MANHSFASTGSTYHSVGAVPALARRLLVERFRGPPNAASTLRARIVRLLEAEDDVDVVAVKALDATETPLDDSPQAYRAVLKELSLSGLVRGKLTRIGPKHRLRLSLVTAEGMGQEDLIYDAASLEGLLVALDKSVVFDLLLQLPDDGQRRKPIPKRRGDAPSAPDGDAPEASASEPPTGSDRKPVWLGACPFFVLGAQSAWVKRSLDYQGEEPGPLRGYRSTVIPAVGGALELRPLSHQHGNCRGLAGLGLRASGSYLLAPRSRLAGEEVASRAWEAAVDLEYRASASIVWAAPFSGFRAREFAIERDLVVDTALRAWRAGLSVGLNAASFRLELHGALELALSTPELASARWFPHAKGLGVDAGGSVAWAVKPQLEILSGASLVAYRFDLRPGEPGSYENGVAQRAVDSYFSAFLGLRWLVDSRR